jgi:hypothetical protein
MITTLKRLRCCCTNLYRAGAVRYGMMMMMLVIGLLSMGQPAAAQTSDTACIKEATGLNNPSCTANDVRIGSYTLVSPGLTSCDPTSDTPITVTIEATIESGPARYDIGIWINQDGNSAKSDPTGNNCFRDFLHPVASTSSNCEPDGPYYNADGDGCGDVHSVTTNPCSNAVTGPCTGGGGGTCVFTTYTFTVDILCRDSDGDGTADVGSCTSWDQGSAAVCSDALDTNPGTGSKCNCGRIDIIGLHTGCSVDGDCNDDNACTTDVCTVVGTVGTCTNETISCDDGNECTADSCDTTSGCVNTDNSARCDDGNACTADSCDTTLGCVNTDNSARCDDGNACTADSCVPATGCVNTDNSARCNDGNACTADSCVPATGCVNTDNSARCDDGNACTADSCVPATGCVNTDNSARCDDGNACTVDSCVPATGCVNTGECANDTQIAPTATTCQDYADGTAADLNELLYGLKGGEVNSVSPGVFFLYDGVHLDSACSIITVTQTDGSWTARIGVTHFQVILYDLNCNKVDPSTYDVSVVNGDITITGVEAGDYILGIKYDPTTLKGYTPPDPSATYTFAVNACGPSGSDSINVNPKP